MKDLPRARKVTGDKNNITLPANYRDAVGIVPGDLMSNLYGEGVIILWPKKLELYEVEEKLIEILAKWRSFKDTGESITQLRGLIPLLEG